MKKILAFFLVLSLFVVPVGCVGTDVDVQDPQTQLVIVSIVRTATAVYLEKERTTLLSGCPLELYLLADMPPVHHLKLLDLFICHWRTCSPYTDTAYIIVCSYDKLGNGYHGKAEREPEHEVHRPAHPVLWQQVPHHHVEEHAHGNAKGCV